jgi:hypothetical protein
VNRHLVERPQVGVADVAQQDDLAVEIIGLDKGADERTRLPSQPADADQRGDIVAAIREHLAPDIEHQLVIFPPLDGGDEQHKALGQLTEQTALRRAALGQELRE